MEAGVGLEKGRVMGEYASTYNIYIYKIYKKTVCLKYVHINYALIKLFFYKTKLAPPSPVLSTFMIVCHDKSLASWGTCSPGAGRTCLIICAVSPLTVMVTLF